MTLKTRTKILRGKGVFFDALNTQTDIILMILAAHSLNSLENEEDEHILSSSEIPLKFKVQNA